MRTWKIVVAVCCLLMVWTGQAMATGVTIRTFTPFADMDFAAQCYMDMITTWEAETENVVEDYSGAMDENWMQSMQNMLAAGQVDVAVLPVDSGLTVQHLLTVGELQEALPSIQIRKMDAFKETDGSQLLAPVRLYWEGLYVNTEVLAKCGVAVPQTFEQLLSACVILAQQGVTPIANALCEWNELVLDCAALAGAPAEAYGKQASLDGAKRVLEALVQVGGFGQDPWNATDEDMEKAFLSGQAAMRFDADLLAQMISEQTDGVRADDVVVINLPAMYGTLGNNVVGMPIFGVTISRACWQDSARREAALSFVAKLLGEEGIATSAQGSLGQSIARLIRNADDATGVLYDAIPDTYDQWAEGVVAGLMGQ